MKTIQNNNFELVDFRTHAGEREIENAIASVNDLDNSDSYLAPSPLAPAKTQKTLHQKT
jgi:5,10-methylene-tetrahydrofolate dehydrogenase/methenyl tetrahydrofolate cyclohydrolase